MLSVSVEHTIGDGFAPDKVCLVASQWFGNGSGSRLHRIGSDACIMRFLWRSH